VAQVVTELEDCPLFNAGKGATLIIDGEHEELNGLIELLFVAEAYDR